MLHSEDMSRSRLISRLLEKWCTKWQNTMQHIVKFSAFISIQSQYQTSAKYFQMHILTSGVQATLDTKQNHGSIARLLHNKCTAHFVPHKHQTVPNAAALRFDWPANWKLRKYDLWSQLIRLGPVKILKHFRRETSIPRVVRKLPGVKHTTSWPQV